MEQNVETYFVTTKVAILVRGRNGGCTFLNKYANCLYTGAVALNPGEKLTCEELTAKMTKAGESSPRNVRVRREAHVLTTASQSRYTKTPEFLRGSGSKMHCQSCES